MRIGDQIRDSHLPGTSPGGAGAVAPARTFLRTALRTLERGLWLLALMTVGWLTYVALDRMVHETQQTRRLRERAATPTLANRPTALEQPPAAATRRPPASGDPIGQIEIPAAGISAIVAAGTALPGEPGNVGLAGHRDTVFRGLRKLRPADRIFVVTARESVEYSVESLQTVAPERGDVLDPSSHPTLTLITCYPFDFIGPAPLGFVVRAREVGRIAAARRPGASTH